MRPRINPNHVGSSEDCREVKINRKAYKATSIYENLESTNGIVDILDEKTFKIFEGMKGVEWRHTAFGHTISITPVEASMLLRNGIKGITVRL